MVTALSGAVIMGVKDGKVNYFRKCNHCQTSEYHNKPYKETDWIEIGIVVLGEFECPSCGGKSEIKLKFYKLDQ
jgi:hypothetical protein